MTLRFFDGALGVEGDQPRQDLLVGERRRPAVRVAHGRVQLVVEFTQHADQPLLVDRLVLGGQRLAGPQLCQHVVHVGQGQLGVLGLLALAVSIQLLGQAADARLLRVGRGGEGEFLEAGCFHVDRIVAHAEVTSSCQRPGHVDAAGEHAQEVGVVQRDVDELVVRQDGSVEKDEEPASGGFDGGDIARNPAKAGRKAARGSP